MGVDPWVNRGDISSYFLKWRGRRFVPYFFGGRHFCTNAHGTHWMIGAIFVKFSQLILMKIIKIVANATRCQILSLKCTKFNFGLGSTPDPAGGAYSSPPDPVGRFKGPTSKRREGKKRKWRDPLYFFSAAPMAPLVTQTLNQLCLPV